MPKAKSALNGHEALREAQALLRGERDPIANAANLVALLTAALDRINWIGFYFVRGNELVLGPFAGKPAVTRILRGDGVCGAAWARARTLVVDDVNAFPGHIGCDASSRSEIVVPLLRDATVVGVLDCDSPHLARFDERDRLLLERFASLYIDASNPL